MYENIEAEMSVIGAILIDSDQVMPKFTQLDGKMFFSEQNGKIFEFAKKRYASGQAVDIVVMLNAFGSGKELKVYLARCMEMVPTLANVESYKDIIISLYRKRELLALLESLKLELAHKGADAVSQKLLQELKGNGQNQSEKVSTAQELAVEFFSELEARSKVKGLLGISTGFIDLDKETSGFVDGNLYLIAGRPAMGKTALAIKMSLACAKAGKKVLFVSLEMSKMQLMERIISMLSGVPHANIRKAEFQGHQWEKVGTAQGEFFKWQYDIIDNSALTPQALRWVLTFGDYDIVFIDYLQYMYSGERFKNQNEEIGFITKVLKGIAKDADVPIVLLSQLSRAVETRQNKRPIMSDLRDSGSIEQDADLVLMIYRDEYYNPNSKDRGKGELAIMKNRHGRTGVIDVAWDSERMIYSDLDKWH